MKTFIFDFDGVIIETERVRFKTVQKLLENLNKNISEERFVSFIGKKTATFLKESFPELPEKVIEDITNKRRELNGDPSVFPLIKGIVELLSYLKKEKANIAITTGSSYTFVKAVLEYYNLTKFFSVVVCGEDFSSSKPDPECFEITLNKLKVEQAIIIEDSPAGIKAGKEVDCEVFGLKTYFSEKDLSLANEVFHNHLEILEFIKSNNIVH